jgi:hypothetical protein
MVRRVAYQRHQVIQMMFMKMWGKPKVHGLRACVDRPQPAVAKARMSPYSWPRENHGQQGHRQLALEKAGQQRRGSSLGPKGGHGLHGHDKGVTRGGRESQPFQSLQQQPGGRCWYRTCRQ